MNILINIFLLVMVSIVLFISTLQLYWIYLRFLPQTTFVKAEMIISSFIDGFNVERQFKIVPLSGSSQKLKVLKFSSFNCGFIEICPISKEDLVFVIRYVRCSPLVLYFRRGEIMRISYIGHKYGEVDNGGLFFFKDNSKSVIRGVAQWMFYINRVNDFTKPS